MVAIIGYFLLSQNCPRRFVVKSMSLLLLANHVDLEWLNTDNDESKHVCIYILTKVIFPLQRGLREFLSFKERKNFIYFSFLLASRFLDNKEDIAKVRKCFAGLWSLDDSENVSKAIENPELYVMKPQREGGGPNIF